MILIALGLALFGKINADLLDYPLVESGVGVLQASSEWNPSHSASRAVLHFDQTREGAQSWSAAFNNVRQWIQISAQTIVRWKSIHTQGRRNSSQWVKSFTVQYNLNGRDWLDYDNAKVFGGNRDRNSVVINELDVPLFARAIRIIPLTWYRHISMRVEAYANDDLEDFSYEPDGTIWVPAIDSGLPVTASSQWNPSHDVSRIRLNFCLEREGSSAWCAAFNDQNQWVQVSSPFPRKWAKISTQGRADSSQWVTSYYVSYTPDGVEWYQADGGRIFTGNCDRNTIVEHIFDEPFEAKAIRIHPIAWRRHMSMRLEVYYVENTTENRS